ncbi:PDR/VanB family oxidoreductase [Leeuwenhoekiella sp. NPDC079379]|uniref:PDR/VanB family oxidoreductase n=1 Tax=Leeuwenhoekiella sp. NPDC079379 TaxID=3364122 RepID=UPI0037CA7E57
MRYRNSWENATITSTELVANNVIKIEIQPEGGVKKFTVGSHIDVSVLINGTTEIRSYSLVGQYHPKAPYTISVKRLISSRGGSNYMWSLKKGSQLKISQPTNHFELSYTTRNYILIAGGIGITPILGMAEQLSLREGISLRMLYLDRNKAEMPYIQHLKNILGNNLEIHYSDTTGYYDVNQLIKIAQKDTQVYLCGPLNLMNSIRKIWEAGPYENSHLHFETFGASGLFAPQNFKIKIPRFNKELKVGENQTILQVLEHENIEIMYDCKKGECGLCQIEVLEYTGDLDHRDLFFSEEEKGENKKMCACVSRVANGYVVIDTAYRGGI